MNYTWYRNTLSTILRVSKKNYYSIQFQATLNDIKGTWKVITNIFKNNSKTSSARSLKIDAELKDDTLLKKCNNYFCSIGPNLSVYLIVLNHSMASKKNLVSKVLFYCQQMKEKYLV